MGGNLGSAPPGGGVDYRTQGGEAGYLGPQAPSWAGSGDSGSSSLTSCVFDPARSGGQQRSWRCSHRVSNVTTSASSTKMSPMERRPRGPTAAGGEGSAPA